MYISMRLARILCVLAAAFVLLVVYLFATPPAQGVPILEYHMVNDSPVQGAEKYAVSVKDFEEQLDYLESQGYHTIRIIDFIKAKKGKFKLPEKPVILTFDDGYEDNYTEMMPRITKRGMTATVYVVVNDIGRDGYLTWDQMREMQAAGIEIGCHTGDHVPITELSDEERAYEVKTPKLLMEWNGINTVFSFSYPNGKYDEKTPKLLKDSEYLSAVTGDAGLNTFDTDPYLMQRINIPPPRFGITEFKLRLLKSDIMTKLGILQHKVK